ncbi:MAG TPA: hypothetical protein VGL80_08950, partial [Pseudonocardiaceae bacterium]
TGTIPTSTDYAMPDLQPTALSATMSPGGMGDGSAFAQGLGGGGMDSAMGGAVGGALAGGQVSGAHMFPQHHDMFGDQAPGHPGVAGTDVTHMGQPGDAGLAAAPEGALNQGDPGQQGQQGGMPMSGMGGGGMGGGQGGDQQRGGNQWRTHGRLFDDVGGDETIGHFSGTLEDGR